MVNNITAIILTFNEENHILRCINNIRKITNKIIIIDSFSTDSTTLIAKKECIEVLQHEWINYASQFNWALTQLSNTTEWILRIDADEILTDQLISEIKNKIPKLKNDINGLYFGRRMTFQGKLIKHGGVFPVKVLRLFKYKKGECENRWMDEHIKIQGKTENLSGEMVDDNINSLEWWINKHNKYSSREVVDLLNLEYKFMNHDSVASLSIWQQPNIKRWIKEKLYAKLPLGSRALIYFLYRYFICFGFLDGREGAMFHFYQGFWYRYLVDSKIIEVKKYIQLNNISVKEAINKVLGIKI